MQECVVPRIVIQAGEAAAVMASLESFSWRGMRCRVKVAGVYDGCTVDLRDKPTDPGTSLATPKTLEHDGSCAILVTTEGREGTATTLVLLDRSGRILDRKPLTVGD